MVTRSSQLPLIVEDGLKYTKTSYRREQNFTLFTNSKAPFLDFLDKLSYGSGWGLFMYL